VVSKLSPHCINCSMILKPAPNGSDLLLVDQYKCFFLFKGPHWTNHKDNQTRKLLATEDCPEV